MICGSLAILLALVGYLKDRLHQERIEAAQTTLQSIAGSLIRADQLGVPMTELVGLDELLLSRGAAEVGIVTVRLFDSGDRLLWKHGAGAEGSTEWLNVPVQAVGRLQAELALPDDADVILRVALTCLAFAAALAIPLLELARMADRVIEGFPSEYFRRQLRRVARGNLRIAWRLLGGGGSDERQRFLRDRIYLLNEQYQRVVHRVGSLQRTEPDATRREQLSELLTRLSTQFRFASAGARIDRLAWPAADTARSYASMTLILANLSLVGSGSTAYAAGIEHYSALFAVVGWVVGMLVATTLPDMRWQVRLHVALGAALVSNLLMTAGTGWNELAAHLSSGFATTFAVCAALDATRGPKRVVTMSLLLAGVVAGPALGLAVIAALVPFATVGWLYGAAAAVTLLVAGAFLYSLEHHQGGRVRGARKVRLHLSPLLAGAAWMATVLVFIAPSESREHALRMLILQVPGFLLLMTGRARSPKMLAAALVVVAVLSLVDRMNPGLVSGDLVALLPWIGAFCVAGAFAAPPDFRGLRPVELVRGFSVGGLVTLGIAALADWVLPKAAGPMVLGVLIVALAAGLVATVIEARGLAPAR